MFCMEFNFEHTQKFYFIIVTSCVICLNQTILNYNFLSFTVYLYSLVSVIHRHFNYFSSTTAYLYDHSLHLFDFKCQTIGQMLAVTKLNI